MDIIEPIHDDFLKGLLTLLQDCKTEVENLRIENGLLRKASEEQRKLNGSLRIELQQMDNWTLGKTVS